MIFPQQTILEIHDAAIRCDFRLVRELLLYGVSKAYIAKIPTYATPSDQLLGDLNYMNANVRERGSVPMAIWLRNAAYRVSQMPEREQMFKRLGEQALAATPADWVGIQFMRTILPREAMLVGGADRESLASAMSDCLTLEDLQTAARQCFGGLSMRPVEGQNPSVRDVALQCIELAERERMEAVFCRAVSRLQQCDAQLQRKLVELYPELPGADQPFSEIVDATSGFLVANADRIAELLGDEPAMNRISMLVSKLRCYKGLHEALHQVKNNPLPSVPEPRSPAADRKFRQDVRQYLTLLVTSQQKSSESLSALPLGDEVRDFEGPWVTLIGGFAQRISVALDLPAENFGRVETELEGAASGLNRLEEFNSRIVDFAKQLLHGPLAALRDGLLAGAQSHELLADAATALNALRLALHVRVLEHTRWQETDMVLFQLDDTLAISPASGFTKFTRGWSVVRNRLSTLTAADGQIDLKRLRELALRVDGTLARIEGELGPGAGNTGIDPLTLMSEPYDAFRYEAQQQFLRIDAGLKRHCSDLARIA